MSHTLFVKIRYNLVAYICFFYPPMLSNERFGPTERLDMVRDKLDNVSFSAVIESSQILHWADLAFAECNIRY